MDYKALSYNSGNFKSPTSAKLKLIAKLGSIEEIRDEILLLAKEIEKRELEESSSCELLASRRAKDRARQRRFVEKLKSPNVTNVTNVRSAFKPRIVEQNQQSYNVTNVSGIPRDIYSSNIERKKVSKEGGVGETIEFEEFWRLYPRRVAKQTAFKAYCKAKKEGASKEQILSGVKLYSTNLPAEAKFIAHPATWLNGKRWLDDPAHLAKSSGPKWLNGIPGVI